MIRPPKGTNPFEFIVVSGQRAAQLMRGCTPKVDTGHKLVSKAQLEVASGIIKALDREDLSGDGSR